MKSLLYVLLPIFLALTFNACEKDPALTDPCYNITCFNDGVCANGLCNCPDGYSGSDCSVELTPVSMTITRIEVTNYPATKSSGAGWDPSSGADPFVVFHSGTGTTYTANDFASSYFTDVTGQDLTFTTGLPITVPSLSSNWSLDMWDYDSIVGDPDDLMAGVFFTPISQANGFPSSIDLNATGFSATLYVTWNF
jgi:hypothetical protein